MVKVNVFVPVDHPLSNADDGEDEALHGGFAFLRPDPSKKSENEITASVRYGAIAHTHAICLMVG